MLKAVTSGDVPVRRGGEMGGKGGEGGERESKVASPAGAPRKCFTYSVHTYPVSICPRRSIDDGVSKALASSSYSLALLARLRSGSED